MYILIFSQPLLVLEYCELCERVLGIQIQDISCNANRITYNQWTLSLLRPFPVATMTRWNQDYPNYWTTAIPRRKRPPLHARLQLLRARLRRCPSRAIIEALLSRFAIALPRSAMNPSDSSRPCGATRFVPEGCG